MSLLLPSAFLPLPHANLLDPSTLDSLFAHFRTQEYVAKQTRQAFAILSLKPSMLLYTSESYEDFAGIQVAKGQSRPLIDWFNSLYSCTGLPLGGHLAPMLQHLADPEAEGKHKIVFDFCKPMNGLPGQIIQQEISFLPLLQEAPHVLLLCTVHCIENLRRPFSHSIKLLAHDRVINRVVITHPVSHHPMLQTLTEKEATVLMHLLQKGDQNSNYMELNMSPNTLRKHQKQILDKTGFEHIEALLGVLKWERRANP